MFTLIRYLDGHLEEAILLSIRGDMMRVAIPGCDDAVAFTLRGGAWVSDENVPVEIEFLAARGEDPRGS